MIEFKKTSKMVSVVGFECTTCGAFFREDDLEKIEQHYHQNCGGCLHSNKRKAGLGIFCTHPKIALKEPFRVSPTDICNNYSCRACASQNSPFKCKEHNK